MNYAIFVGKIIELPTLKETTQGVKYSSMVIEVPRNFRNSDGEMENDLIHFTLWRGVAEDATANAQLGHFVAVKTRVQTRCYQSEQGNTFYNYEFIAEKVTFLK